MIVVLGQLAVGDLLPGVKEAARAAEDALRLAETIGQGYGLTLQEAINMALPRPRLDLEGVTELLQVAGAAIQTGRLLNFLSNQDPAQLLSNLNAKIDLDTSGLARLQAQLGEVSLATGAFGASVTGLEELANMLTSGGVTVLAFAGERNTFPAELGDALNGLGTASSSSGAIVLLAQTPAAMNVLKGAFPVAATVLGQAGLA
jgi:hypothetical protein